MINNTKSYPKISIIMLNWNQKDMTLACLTSLQKTNYPNYEIILVDNASTDDSVSAVQKEFSDVTLLENQSNLGVAGGRNVGLEYVKKRDTDYILFLDNDTTVHEDFLSEMVKVGERDKKVGILTGKIYFYSEPNKIWCAGGTLNLYRCQFSLRGYDEFDKGQYEKTQEVDHVTGCMFMIKKELVEKLGFLDEDFVQYFGEDTDWCLKAKKEGFKIVYVPKAMIWHHVVKKTTVSDRYWYLKGRNLLLFMRKHARVHHWIVFSLYFVVGSLKVFFRELIAGNLKEFFTMAKGALNAFKIKKKRRDNH
jgi:GT2 family glycosyltransferase